MVSLGIFLVIIGFGSLLFPAFDLQFRLMELVDPYQPWAGIMVGLIGAGLVAWGTMQRREAAPPPSAPPPPAA